MEPYKKITLENGLRVILVPQPQSLTTTMLVLVEAGSKYETKEINGLSHFLEHMCFKGTEKRPRPIDIAVELDRIGGASNAFTSHEYTGYYAKAQRKHFPIVLDLVSDVYLHSTFDAQEIDKERGVIIEENNYRDEILPNKAAELFMELLYGDQPAGWGIGGKKEVIQRLSRDQFLAYRAAHYVPHATIVVVAGSFDESTILEEIKNIFSAIPSSEKGSKTPTREYQEQPAVMVKHKATDQTHLVMGVRAFDTFDTRRYALQVLVNVLGGGMSSRLFQRIREEMGAGYYVSANDDLYTDHGYLAVSAGVEHVKIESVITAVLEEFSRLVTTPVPSDELQKAKDHLMGGLVLHLETSEDLANYYGGQEVVERELLTPEEVSAKIQAVTVEEIMAVAQDIFKNEKLNLVVVGPFEDKERFLKILKLD